MSASAPLDVACMMVGMRNLARVAVLAATLCGAVTAAVDVDRVAVADVLRRLTRDTRWTPVQTIAVATRTYHPQGLVKIGDVFFVSTVEVTRRRTSVGDGGAGVGHVLQLDAVGKLQRRIRLGEGTVYHPGGMDFDGSHLWVPVAEYRPDSSSIVYRVDPVTLAATEAFRFADHIGALVYDPDDRSLHGVSWGSRRFYRWALDASGRPISGGTPRRIDNVSHYVDYQDCKYAGRHRMLCTGVSTIGGEVGDGRELGGLELVDLTDGRPLHQLPIALRTRAGVSMTRNPSWFEPFGGGIRAYFMPEDDESSIHVFDAMPR